jgi:hypothetical protein
MQTTYKNIKLIAAMLLLWVLSNGYHLFHYVGYKTGWHWAGYIITPILYSILIGYIVVKQRKWVTTFDIKPIGWPQFKWYYMILLALVFIGVAFFTNYAWEYINHLDFKIDLWLDFKLSSNRFGLIKGSLITFAYFISNVMKAYLAILIGFYAYHWIVVYGDKRARVVMVLAWLVTLGLSQTIYFGTKYGFISVISLLVGGSLTLFKPKYVHYVWLYLVMSFVF